MTRQRVRRLVGETVREVGTLILVFAPLESAFAERPFQAAMLIGVLGISLMLIASGILMQAGN